MDTVHVQSYRVDKSELVGDELGDRTKIEVVVDVEDEVEVEVEVEEGLYM